MCNILNIYFGKYELSSSSSLDIVLLMFEVKMIRIPSAGWWVGLGIGIFSSLQGWLCVGVLCFFRVTYNEQGLAMWWNLKNVKPGTDAKLKN
jgi:hypothetical protein